MKNITPIFEKYREAARHLRNTYYVPADQNDWDLVDDFAEASLLLFKHLVLGKLRLAREGFDWFEQSSSQFIVESKADDLPIMINRKYQSGYWDNPITKVKRGELTMHFIGYFDWDNMCQIDFRYYRVRIAGSEKYPQVVAHDALIETIYAEVYQNEIG